jgi:hypothetical protein
LRQEILEEGHEGELPAAEQPNSVSGEEEMTAQEFYGGKITEELEKEFLQVAIDVLNHKDRLDSEDLKTIETLKTRMKKITEKLAPKEPIKNVYNEMVRGLMEMVRPNGTWKGNPAREWHDLRKQVVDFIFEKKREKGG